MKIGFIGFGEVNSPREMLEEKIAAAKERLMKKGLEVYDGGLVTDDIDRKEAAAAVERLRDKKFDVLIICLAGWVPSYAVIRTADHFKELPMVLWGLCGSYNEKGRLVTTAEQAGTSALRRPMQELGFQFQYVYDTTDGICGENVTLNCVISDKNVVIRDGITLSGVSSQPYYISKGRML